MKMLGTPDDPKLKTKGAETWGLVLFLTDMLQKYSAGLGEDVALLIEAGRTLIDVMGTMHMAGNTMTTAEVQEITPLPLRKNPPKEKVYVFALFALKCNCCLSYA